MKKLLGMMLLIAALIYFIWPKTTRTMPSEPGLPVISAPPATPTPKTLGDRILAPYASPNSTGAEDLKLFYHYVNNVFTLVKKRDTRQYATNFDLAQFLLGENDYSTPYLSPKAKILDEDQLLVDRWDNPLHIHPISSDLLEIRSAGPDQKLFTEDDLLEPHRD